MRRLRSLVSAFALAATVCLPMRMPSFADDKRDAAQLFQKAADLTDIRSAGSASFQLDAKVQMWGFDGKPISGSYSLVWVSINRWREVLLFSGYSRIRVGGDGKYWQQRSLDYEPIQLSELSDSVDFASSLRAAKPSGELKSRQESGRTFECAHIAKDSTDEYCFDPSQSVLVLEKIHGAAGVPLSVQYSDFQAFGEKRFPAQIQVTAGGAPIADFSVTRLANIESTALSNLAPPDGASMWLTCSNPQKPRLINSVQPVYPSIEKTAHRQGEVLMYAIIATDGTLQNVRILAAPSPRLGDSAVDAARRWRYEPRRCGEVPTPTEIFLRMFFTLGSN